MSDIVERLLISRTYVRGPGDIGYDTRGEIDKSDGKPVGHVEDERKEAAAELTALRASNRELMGLLRAWVANGHTRTCQVVVVPGVTHCDCGYDRARTALERGEK